MVFNKENFERLGSGSTFKEVSKSVLRSFKVHLPPLPEQRKIAAILTSADEAIKKTEAIIKQTEKVKRGLMQRLLMKGIGHTTFKQTEIGEIPVDWGVNVLSDICLSISIGLVTTMTKHYVEDGVPLIRNSDIKENKIRKDNLIRLNNEFAEVNNSRRLKEGDIVTVHTGDIGTSAVIDKELNGSHGFATINTRVNKEVVNEFYLCYFFNSKIFKDQAYSISTGDGRNNLNLKDFEKTQIIYPSELNEQERIVNIIDSVNLKIEKQKQKLSRLLSLKKGLMQSLLTGKVRVNVVDEYVEVVV